ncbi:uncharacterized protein LOC110228373 [Arabidopsis lyrata subsp. lyrata]|uniref:uncharacterized protein LOC110228373 n=1 Tax=Arabidopsis lyrata subsp. lyrata TaxID=81972 RepID=UPI000A29BA6F|nr:uncharacterized protein LOC110228373 [Arabidopsis lyrata subsp. lyrata]|eukprot:XP_020881321.1 uncharacterized protein LOC110228373 [Arabidopsis lyrata subsp. lyrata]
MTETKHSLLCNMSILFFFKLVSYGFLPIILGSFSSAVSCIIHDMSLCNSAKTVVFWDMEDCPIPDGLDAHAVKDNIRMGLKEKGYHGYIESVSAYGDYQHMRDRFGGFYVSHWPDRDGRRTMMLLDFLNYNFGNHNSPPVNLMLILGDISGDMGFIGAIRAIKRKCNVLLSQPQNISEVPDVLTKWPWKSLATGEDLM